MRCFFCGSEQSVVIDKRAVKSSGEIRRRRECIKCGNRFTTYERVSVVELFVLKRDGSRQIFSREKLREGIVKSLEKRPSLGEADKIVDGIITKLRVKKKKEIESKVLGKEVLSALKKVDKVAYIRFASVYRQFDNPGDFEKELANLGIAPTR